MANCGKPAALLTPFMSYPCVLPEGHKDECAPGGTCVAHGPFIAKPNAQPQCPEWPKCVTVAMDLAKAASLDKFKNEYEGTACAVCQQEKWANSPFCRTCSIKLQRAKLMHELKEVQGYYGDDLSKWPPQTREFYSKHYDRCRAYLIDVRRHFGSQSHGTEQQANEP